jgi:hypothetical protein
MRIPFSMLCQLALNHFCPLYSLDFQNEHICHYTLVVIIRGKKEHTHLEREESYHHAFQAGCLPIYPFRTYISTKVRRSS